MFNFNVNPIKEIVEMCEFCNEDDSIEIVEEKNMANQKFINCLFKEVRRITNRL